MKDILGFFGEHRWLSNFAPVEVELDWVVYPSVEHAYQAAKIQDFDQRIAFLSATKDSPKSAKKLGATGKQLRPDWQYVKEQVMLDLLMQKFASEPYMQKLLETGDCYIEETNMWKDTFWGVCNGVGENKLGRMIMDIRKDLRHIIETASIKGVSCHSLTKLEKNSFKLAKLVSLNQ